MNFAKPKIYDADGKEIIPPEDAVGFAVGENGKFEWVREEDYSAFIYTPDPYVGPLSENVEEAYKFNTAPIITDETWFLRLKGKKSRMKSKRKSK